MSWINESFHTYTLSDEWYKEVVHLLYHQLTMVIPSQSDILMPDKLGRRIAISTNGIDVPDRHECYSDAKDECQNHIFHGLVHLNRVDLLLHLLTRAA